VFNAFSQPDTIAAGSALSIGAQINGLDLVGLLMPAGWDAAVITLQQSIDQVTWSDVYDASGAEMTVQTAAGRYVRLPAGALALGTILLTGIRFIRIRSGTGAVPLPQSAPRTLTWLSRNYRR
jgi:hypothetical protein